MWIKWNDISQLLFSKVNMNFISIVYIYTTETNTNTHFLILIRKVFQFGLTLILDVLSWTQKVWMLVIVKQSIHVILNLAHMD